MKIAILGASSNIAKDLILNFANKNPDITITLFGRNLRSLKTWLKEKKINTIERVFLYKEFSYSDAYDVLFNFVGIGDPAKVISVGSDIIDLTYQYDKLALNYLENNPETKYIFLSSGAAYGSKNFTKNVDSKTKSIIDIQDHYSIAKIQAESRHRSLPDKSIIDIRVFNYINSDIDLNSSFLIADAVNAIINKETLQTSSKNIFRDYIGPDDFYKLILCLINQSINESIDCYTRSPLDKFSMLDMLRNEFGLSYNISCNENDSFVPTFRDNYYSKNFKAKLYGYYPELTSLETIYKEVDLFLKKTKY